MEESTLLRAKVCRIMVPDLVGMSNSKEKGLSCVSGREMGFSCAVWVRGGLRPRRKERGAGNIMVQCWRNLSKVCLVFELGKVCGHWNGIRLQGCSNDPLKRSRRINCKT